ncbi:MAG: FecR domain-containing protein [Proteobacteria bacterium]|nr:FecR domain-containing protein [Pseudomonadota bacterium]
MKRIQIILYIIVFLFITPSVNAISAVASIKTSQGDVKIQRVNRMITGRKGLVLNDEDLIITGQSAKATILFRDGSEIRLFQNTRFVIEKSQEAKGARRGFLNRFKLNVGAFWGKFAKGSQTTKIVTPTATCGIKGTNASFSQRKEGLNVSLSQGAIELENEDEKIVLHSGKMIKGVTKRGSFKHNVTDIPYRIGITPDSKKIQIPTEGNEGKINFTIQIYNVKTKHNVERSGNIFISLPLDKIVFPSKIRLNKRGYKRVTARIKPFQKGDYGNGRVEITAIADGESYMNVGSGQTILTFDIPEKIQKTIRIDANTGKIR